MNLTQLISKVEVVKVVGDINIEIEKVIFSSKEKCKNALFVCLVGTNTDGHDFVLEALSNGAVAIVCQKELDIDIPQIIVCNTRRTLAVLSANFWGNPAEKLKLIGVTGTNGKTSTTMIIRQICLENNCGVGVIGTLGYHINKQSFDCDLTTPDPFKLHEIFKQMMNAGVKVVAMEVSAHAIALEKIYGLKFEIGILTNITQDHLDFFKTMEKYASTKIDFLKSNQIKTLVLNSDDSYFSQFKENYFISYGISNPAECFAMEIALNLKGSSFIANILDNVMKIKTKLCGYFNIYNILAAATTALLLGFSTKSVEKALRKIGRVDGRFNIIETSKGNVVIDFAHTPDGLENILKNIKQLSMNEKIITVFGCGGNRDALKRPIMGKIADRYSDVIILTSDNPRFENPDLISDDILQGIENKDKCLRENDRKKAIKKAIEMLNGNEVVVVCGKGGEKYQDINGVLSPYDDIKVVKNIVKVLNL